MSAERICIRNCTQRDVHYATCTTSGPEWADRDDRCRGCAPRVCRDGSLICDRCFGIMSRLLADTPDLLGRLRSLADPLKANPTDNVRTGSRGILEAQPPVPVDLLDAIDAVTTVYGFYRSWGSDLTALANNVEDITYLASMVLDRHPAVDGVRWVWSVQDAVDQWGVERRTTGDTPWTDDEDSEEVVGYTHEWQGRDRVLSRIDTAKALQISESTMWRMERAGFIEPRRAFQEGRPRVRFVLSEAAAGLKAYRAAEVAP